jgi:hypothetical protein
MVEALRNEAPRGVPDGARARVGRRIEHTIAGLAGFGVTSGPPLSKGMNRVFAEALHAFGTRPLWVAATAFALGGVAGARIQAALETSPIERVIYVDRIVDVEPTPPPAPTALEPPAVTSGRAIDARSPGRPGSAANASPAATPATGLAAERSLLDEARKALGAGDYAAALRATDLHAARFPAGLLLEEREALAIKTLAAAGRRPEAESLAKKFRQRFPKSLFGPTVDEALETNP